MVSGRGYRSIRLDIHAVDGAGEEADIEIQRQDRGADSKRARLHSAILDSSMLKAGQEFDEMFYPELAEKVRELKETKGGQDRMCKLMEDMRNEAQREGEMKKAKETAFELADMGLSAEKIAKAVKVNLEMVRRWLSEKLSVAR